MVGGSVQRLAKVAIGVAVKRARPLPDISVDAFKSALLAARRRLHRPGGRRLQRHLSVAMVREGGIADRIKPQGRAGTGRPGGAAAGQRPGRPRHPPDQRNPRRPRRPNSSARSRPKSRTTPSTPAPSAAPYATPEGNARYSPRSPALKTPGVLKDKGWRAVTWPRQKSRELKQHWPFRRCARSIFRSVMDGLEPQQHRLHSEAVRTANLGYRASHQSRRAVRPVLNTETQVNHRQPTLWGPRQGTLDKMGRSPVHWRTRNHRDRKQKYLTRIWPDAGTKR